MNMSAGGLPQESSSSLVQRVQPLLEEIRERAPAIEEARQVPGDIIRKLIDIGLIRAMVPAEHGGGEVEFLDCDNESVLAFRRHTEDETLLVLANLASTARHATVKLPSHAGRPLRDVFGGAQFGTISEDGTATFTLGSREFFWLALEDQPDVG